MAEIGKFDKAKYNKQYRETHREQCAASCSSWWGLNRDRILKLKNEKHKCDICDGYYTTAHKVAHERTLIHIRATGHSPEEQEELIQKGIKERKEIRKQTIAENKLKGNNKQSHASSKYKGVYWCKSMNKWAVRIFDADGKKYRCGNYNDEIEAAKAYNKRAVELFGPDVYLNDI